MSQFRAVVHRVQPRGVLVRLYSKIDKGWRSIGALTMPESEWASLKQQLQGVLVFEGVPSSYKHRRAL